MNVRGLAVVAALCAIGPLAAQSRHLNAPSQFDTRGDVYSPDFLQDIYAGRFELVRQRLAAAPEDFGYVFSGSAVAYGLVCEPVIAADSPNFEITSRLINYYGSAIDSQTRAYRIDTRFAKKVDEYGISFFKNRAADGVLTVLRNNGCVSPQTIQYLENLLRFAYGRKPVQQEPPEPMARYELAGDARRGGRNPKATQETIREALFEIDHMPIGPGDLRARASQSSTYYEYRRELGPIDDITSTTKVLACRYADPAGESESYPHYYWQNPRPPAVTDAWLKTLSPKNPLRDIGVARASCPNREPSGPHPVDVRARLPVK